MQKVNNTDFLSMSSYIRVQEKRLLDHGGMDRIADAPSAQDALRMITQSSDYDFGTLRRPEEYEDVVKGELRRVYKMAYEVSRKFPALPEIMGCKYDFHNVKVALKSRFLEGKVGTPYIRATPVDPDEIQKIAEKFDSKSNLPAHLLRAIQAGTEAFESTENPQDIDIVVDKAMYAYMLARSEELGSAMITGYVRAAIDFYNVKTLVRVKSMQKGTAFLAECLSEGGTTDASFFLQNYGKTGGALSLSFAFKNYGDEVKEGIDAYERTGNYADLERLLDNYLIDFVKDAKRISFGPEILFTYLVSKENEIRQIRIVMACKLNGVPVEILKERLRDNYV